MRSIKMLFLMLIFILSIHSTSYASTSVVTLYETSQQVLATTGSTDVYEEKVDKEGYVRVKITCTDNSPFELHVIQEALDTDYGMLYGKDAWTQKNKSYVWEGHAPVSNGKVQVTVRMNSAVMYGIKIQWTEFENGNGYKLSKQYINLLEKDTALFTVTRDTESTKYIGGMYVETTNPAVVKIVNVKKNQIKVKALSTGKSTIKVVLDNKQTLSCKVNVTNNVYKCSKPSYVEYNDAWQCEAFVTKAKFTKNGNMKLNMQLNSYWMNRGYGWTGNVVCLDADGNTVLNISVDKQFYVPYGTTNFIVKVPKKYVRIPNVNLCTSSFTSIGRVVSY